MEKKDLIKKVKQYNEINRELKTYLKEYVSKEYKKNYGKKTALFSKHHIDEETIDIYGMEVINDNEVKISVVAEEYYFGGGFYDRNDHKEYYQDLIIKI